MEEILRGKVEREEKTIKIDFSHNIILDKQYGHEYSSSYLSFSNIYVVKSSQKILHLLKEGILIVSRKKKF
jgi:hypothetical protein